MSGIEPNLWWQLALWLVLGLSLLITLIGAVIVAKDYLEGLYPPEPKRTEINTRLRSLK